ncbi:ComF family protein [Nautilia sp.]
MKLFANEIKEKLYIIPIDDKTDKGYSHTAILAHSMETKYLKPLYNSLLAANEVKYAGKPLEFRLKNPRNFIYTGVKSTDVILVDDISTSGLTLQEAKECLSSNGVNVAFSVVLANLSK